MAIDKEYVQPLKTKFLNQFNTIQDEIDAQDIDRSTIAYHSYFTVDHSWDEEARTLSFYVVIIYGRKTAQVPVKLVQYNNQLFFMEFMQYYGIFKA